MTSASAGSPEGARPVGARSRSDNIAVGRQADATSIPYLAVGERQAIAEAREIYVRWSDDGQHIRKWDFKPFDGGTCFLATPTTNAPVAEQKWPTEAEWNAHTEADRRALLDQHYTSLTKNVATNADMRGALEQAATWFEEYATEHYAKALTAPDSREQHGREVKGKTNRDRAAFLRTVLQGDQS